MSGSAASIPSAAGRTDAVHAGRAAPGATRPVPRSRSSAGRRSAVGVVLASVLLAPAGLAQAPRPPGAPVPLAPQAPAAPGPEAAIQAEPLAPPSPDAAGLLAPGEGGLPEPVWQGTRRAVVERLLPVLPAGTPSPTLRALQRRLLLTAAEPPGGDGPSLAALRVEALQRMGATGDAAALAEAASLADDPRTARLRVRAHLLAGTTRAVCGGVPGLDEAGALTLSALCQAIDGRPDAALLTAGLLREAGGGDPGFLALLDAVAGAAPAAGLSGPSAFGPEHLALLRAARLPVPGHAIEAAGPDMLAALAAGPLADPAVRLDAAERAATLDLLGPDRLAAAYEAGAADTVRGAIFARLATDAPPAERAALVAEATAGLPVPVLAGPVGALWADALAGAEIRAPAAFAVARLLLARDRGVEAAPWLAALGGDGAPLLPAAVLAGAVGADSGLAAWLDGLDADDGAALHRAAGVLAVLRAGGAAIPDDAWLAVLGPARVPAEIPSPALLRWLRDAALSGAVGETVLTALVLMGEDAPADAAPATVAAVVEALRAVGLDAEARRIAIEAVLPATG